MVSCCLHVDTFALAMYDVWLSLFVAVMLPLFAIVFGGELQQSGARGSCLTCNIPGLLCWHSASSHSSVGTCAVMLLNGAAQ